jgi:hypothetical protein
VQGPGFGVDLDIDFLQTHGTRVGTA